MDGWNVGLCKGVYSFCFLHGLYVPFDKSKVQIPLKNRKSFISFNIVDLYPSITESLLDQSIDWATQFTAITDSDIRIIKHARKSLLFHDGLPWVKRDSSNAFDVTMGSYDGAEICELVGLFILWKLKDTFGNNIGLYRDDGLVLLDKKSGRLSDKARNDLTHAFNKLLLNITAQANQLSTNFLDITFIKSPDEWATTKGL